MKQNVELAGWTVTSRVGARRPSARRHASFASKGLMLLACGAAPWIGILLLLRLL
jgi:hypothetical protein